VARTFSEYLFEWFCDERGIPCSRIPETTAKTPDYDLFPETTPVVVEVKEIAPNAEAPVRRVMRARLERALHTRRPRRSESTPLRRRSRRRQRRYREFWLCVTGPGNRSRRAIQHQGCDIWS
jgi:hypothetical protein